MSWPPGAVIALVCFVALVQLLLLPTHSAPLPALLPPSHKPQGYLCAATHVIPSGRTCVDRALTFAVHIISPMAHIMWPALVGFTQSASDARELTASRRELTRGRLMSFLLRTTCGTFEYSMAGSSPFLDGLNSRGRDTSRLGDPLKGKCCSAQWSRCRSPF